MTKRGSRRVDVPDAWPSSSIAHARQAPSPETPRNLPRARPLVGLAPASGVGLWAASNCL